MRKKRRLRTQDVPLLPFNSRLIHLIIYLLRFAHWILLNVSFVRPFTSHIILVHYGSNRDFFLWLFLLHLLVSLMSIHSYKSIGNHCTICLVCVCLLFLLVFDRKNTNNLSTAIQDRKISELQCCYDTYKNDSKFLGCFVLVNERKSDIVMRIRRL